MVAIRGLATQSRPAPQWVLAQAENDMSLSGYPRGGLLSRGPAAPLVAVDRVHSTPVGRDVRVEFATIKPAAIHGDSHC